MGSRELAAPADEEDSLVRGTLDENAVARSLP
jgi:hypothetical protein